MVNANHCDNTDVVPHRERLGQGHAHGTLKIAYVAAGMNLALGVGKKVLAQLDAWQQAGHDARLFVQSSRPPAADGGLPHAREDVEVLVAEVAGGRSSLVDLMRRRRMLESLATSVRRWRPDLIYLRFTTYYPAIERLVREIPTVIEVNTDDVREYRETVASYRYLYHRWRRGRLFGPARGLACVTSELARSANFVGFRKPIFVSGNGIDLRRYTPLAPPPAHARPRLAFIGSPGAPWHGIDKILALASRCPDWDFDVIGLDGATSDGAAPNVAFHGPLERAAYEPVLARADVGIGSLALHRKGMDEASPLKVREYLAFGLPVIIGYRDTDFPDGAEFVLELPNAPDNVSRGVERIRAFVERSRGRRVPREAVAHLDVRVKEARRLDFFCRVLGDRRFEPDGRGR